MIERDFLEQLYIKKGHSVQSIANELGCSVTSVRYWMDKYNIKMRSLSEAIYLWHNPEGDPFKFRLPKNDKEAVLYGIGLGLYWGEGNKTSRSSIRFGNSDPRLICLFIDFLVTFFGIKKADLKLGLQIFSDMDIEYVLDFWVNNIKVNNEQFHRPTVTISGSIGTYKHKSKYGVVTVHYNNVKAVKKLQSLLPV